MAKAGASFEIEVRDHIQASINAGDLGIDPALAVVRHKAKYWSDKREDTIITDVSVELYRPKQKDFWWLRSARTTGRWLLARASPKDAPPSPGSLE